MVNDAQTKLSVTSPCKVNLSLTILGKREDGFHELTTHMLKVNVCDELHFEKRDAGGIKLKVLNHPELENEDNLVMRAAKRILTKDKSVFITLDKRLPFGAGLGGGSANAGVTLCALNLLFQVGLTEDELAEHASELGSDVPFFATSMPLCIARGRGTELSPLALKFPIYAVIVYPGFSVETAWAYQNLNAPPLEKSLSSQNVLTFCHTDANRKLIVGEFSSVEDIVEVMTNDLEKVVFTKHPELRDIKAKLEACGAKKALMSGSGSSVFGLFDSRSAAESAKKQLSPLYPWVAVGSSEVDCSIEV